MRATIRLGLTLVALALMAQTSWAFGPAVHRTVNAKALDTLPAPLKGFYGRHRAELPSLALEPSFPEEGLDRRFPVDRYLPFPFAELPRSEAAFKQRFPEEPGRLPFLVHESYGRLVEAFRAGDRERILQESDALAGLVTDLRNPLALTENADGQKTGQHGLWVRLSVRLPELAERSLKLAPDAAHLLDDPDDYVFSVLPASYVWADNALYLEELAKRGKGGYTEIYYDALRLRLEPLLRQWLSEAARDVGSYFYTAWVSAGKPALP